MIFFKVEYLGNDKFSCLLAIGRPTDPSQGVAIYIVNAFVSVEDLVSVLDTPRRFAPLRVGDDN